MASSILCPKCRAVIVERVPIEGSGNQMGADHDFGFQQEKDNKLFAECPNDDCDGVVFFIKEKGPDGITYSCPTLDQ